VSFAFFSAFGPRFSLPECLDLIFLYAEIIGMSHLNLFDFFKTYINFFNIGTSLFMRVTGFASNRWSSQSTVFYVTVWWILLVSLAAYGLLRTLEVFKRRGRGLFKKFVIYKTDDGALDPDCTSGIYVLTGRAIWKHHIS